MIISYPLRTDSGASWLTTILTELLYRGKVELKPSPISSSVFPAGRYFARYKNRNINTKLVTKPLPYNLSCL